MWFYRKVDQGKALVVTRPGKIDVSFTPRLVVPAVNRVEIMDISLNAIEIDRRGVDGLICGDNIRADIKVVFFVRVNKTKEDVIRVAQSIGCKRASDPQTLEQLFTAKFSEALKTVGKQLDFVDLYTKREEFRDQIIKVIGRDLNGYILEDAAIDYLEQTPLESLDRNNILDAQGIRKITEMTAHEHVRTNEFVNFEKKQIKKQDVEAQEAIYALERQEADALAKQLREIATVQAREEAETAKVQAEELLKSETARITTAEEVEIAEENRGRQVAVAQKNKERVIAVETERVEKDRALEQISRERETELQRIDKDKALEVEKREIANVVRERVIVDKTVAEEEERIKELRLIEEAKRNKDSAIIRAEGEAQEKLVKDIKAAEAEQEAAKFKAQQVLIMAEAELEAADKNAQAKIRLADGTKAESAAAGLADVLVKEQDATATEKQGLAEATAMRAKMTAEATGIEAKARAMATLDERSRQHEEFRIRLDKDKTIESEAIQAQREVAEAQARVLSSAFEKANIDIIGGNGEFFDRIAGSITMGKQFDGFLRGSSKASHVLEGYFSGAKDLPSDVKDILTGLSHASAEVQNLTLSAFLTKLMASSDDDGKRQLAGLIKTVEGGLE